MDSGGKPEEEQKADTPARPKATGWRISEGLRHLLTSHAEYLSWKEGKEISTESMVAKWLEERLRIENRKRSLETLGLKEENLPKSGI
jgi:hypothetical protein